MEQAARFVMHRRAVSTWNGEQYVVTCPLGHEEKYDYRDVYSKRTRPRMNYAD
jgi:hypothetical protein